MATAYALKYPGRLNKLILASPVGIPEDPYAINAEMPGPEMSGLQNEFTEDQEDIVNGKADKAKAAAKEPPKRPFPKWLTYLWDANVSPFGIVRWAGPFGPRLVSGWTSRRFANLPAEESQALHDYSYALFRQRGSGEYALAHLLAPGAFARSPLINRIAGVGRQPLPTNGTSRLATPTLKKETGLPVILMYGEHDWMDIGGGYGAEQKLKEARAAALKTATAEEKQAEKGSARVIIIKNSGHHVYLDGADQFNEMMRKEMVDTLKKDRVAKPKV